MGKFTLTFDTETEADAIKRHMVADEMANIIFEITHNLKKKCQWEFENSGYHPEALTANEFIFTEIFEIINNNNIDITEL